MLGAELTEIIANLRVLGADIADVEVKNSSGGLPSRTRPGPGTRTTARLAA